MLNGGVVERLPTLNNAIFHVIFHEPNGSKLIAKRISS